MLSNLDFCLKVLKIIQDKQIICDELYSLINIQLELLQFSQLPQKLESFEENIVRQLDFYRNEGKNLNQIRQDLQLKYKKLKQVHSEQKQINDELKQILRTQKQEINDLKQQIQQQQQEQQQTPRPISMSMQTPKIYNKFQDTMIQMRKQDKSFQDGYMAPQLTIEIKNIRTPFLEKDEPHDLRELFLECVKQMYQENQIRKNPNIKQMRDTFFQRNYQGEMKLNENDQKISLQKMDIKQLTTKFFLHPHFLKMVESQIFNLKCCTNMNCLYNFQRLKQQAEQVEQPQIFEKTHVKPFREVQNRSFSIGRSNDSRLQYQQVFAQVLRLEREISIMTGRNQRKRASELQNELKKANQELCSLQLKLLQ